jgi:hypothetical protein
MEGRLGGDNRTTDIKPCCSEGCKRTADPIADVGVTMRLLTGIADPPRKGNLSIVGQDDDKSSTWCGQRVKALQSNNAAKLIRLFSSARKRPALKADELLIFMAIGYLNVSVTGSEVIVIRPVSLIEVARLLGIPKETVRRKTTRLVDIEYLECTSKGIVIRQLGCWCRLLEFVS